MLLLIVIFLGMLIFIFSLIFFKSKAKKTIGEYCENNSDCSSGYLCRVNTEMQNKKMCLPTNQKFCVVFPNTELQKCSLSEPDSCDICENSPKYSCVDVKPDNPYVWTDGTTKYNIPNSDPGFGWCLPKFAKNEVTCNPFTSDTVLQINSQGELEWGCNCKYPTLFDKEANQNCTTVRACGQRDGRGKLVVPLADKSCKSNSDCASGDLCMSPLLPPPCGNASTQGIIPNIDCSDPKANCVCHTPWSTSGQSLDPFTGRCSCVDTLDYQCIDSSHNNYNMNCVSGFCSPFGEDFASNCNKDKCYGKETGACICCACPKGFIRCPDDIPSSNTDLIKYCENNGPTCIADPCATPDVPDGYWDLTKNTCVCPGDTAVVVADQSSVVGEVCRDACGRFNPCGGRGKCVIVNNKPQCTDCVSPFSNKGDGTCTCSTTDGKMGSGEACCHDADCASGDCEGASCKHVTTPDGEVVPPFPGICKGNGPSAGPDTCVPSQTGPVLCGSDGTDYCPEKTTCCLGSDKKTYNCCPFDKGICCDDGEHCCPSDHPVCIPGYCTKTDGSGAIPWSGNK